MSADPAGVTAVRVAPVLVPILVLALVVWVVARRRRQPAQEWEATCLLCPWTASARDGLAAFDLWITHHRSMHGSRHIPEEAPNGYLTCAQPIPRQATRTFDELLRGDTDRNASRTHLQAVDDDHDSTNLDGGPR